MEVLQVVRARALDADAVLGHPSIILARVAGGSPPANQDPPRWVAALGLLAALALVASPFLDWLLVEEAQAVRHGRAIETQARAEGRPGDEGGWADWGLRRRSARRREEIRKTREDIGCPPPADELTGAPIAHMIPGPPAKTPEMPGDPER